MLIRREPPPRLQDAAVSSPQLGQRQGAAPKRMALTLSVLNFVVMTSCSAAVGTGAAVGGSTVGLSLLETSGAANGTVLAAASLCGESALALFKSGVLTIMHGPTPFVVGRFHYHGGWDTSPVAAAVGAGESTLAVLHSSGFVQWVRITSDCSAMTVVGSHLVEGGMALAAADTDGSVLVACSHPSPSSLRSGGGASALVVASPTGGSLPADLDGHGTCDGTWVTISTLGDQLLLVCSPQSDEVSLTLLGRPTGGKWATMSSSASPTIFYNGSRTWACPTPLLTAELLDVYGDLGVTAVLISADTTVSLFDAWSGDPSLPAVGATGQPWSPSRQLDPGRTWGSATAASFIMSSYPSSENTAVSGSDMQLIGLRVPDSEKSGMNEFVVNILVFGKSVHLERRQASLRTWKGQRQFSKVEHTMTLPIDGDQVRGYLISTNADCFSFSVCDRGGSLGDNSSTAYVQFVRFLDLTANFSVNGRQLRVALVLNPPTEATEGSGCGPPGDSPLTSWNDTALFDGTHYYNATGYTAWGEIMGRLAAQYPHLVSLDIDDMSHDINPPWLTFTPDVVANITANMRRHAPWLTLAPTIYFAQTIPSFERWPDLPLALDSPIFFFRNQREGAGPCAPPQCSKWWGSKAKRLPNGTVDCPTCGCLAWTCAEPTVYNAPGEAAVMATALPEGRNMLLGFYASGHSSLGEPSPRYVRELLTIAWGLPRVMGTSIWTVRFYANIDDFIFILIMTLWC